MQEEGGGENLGRPSANGAMRSQTHTRERRGQEAPPPSLDKFSAWFGPFREDGLPVAPKAMSCLVIKVF